MSSLRNLIDEYLLLLHRRYGTDTNAWKSLSENGSLIAEVSNLNRSEVLALLSSTRQLLIQVSPVHLVEILSELSRHGSKVLHATSTTPSSAPLDKPLLGKKSRVFGALRGLKTTSHDSLVSAETVDPESFLWSQNQATKRPSFSSELSSDTTISLSGESLSLDDGALFHILETMHCCLKEFRSVTEISSRTLAFITDCLFWESVDGQFGVVEREAGNCLMAISKHVNNDLVLEYFKSKWAGLNTATVNTGVLTFLKRMEYISVDSNSYEPMLALITDVWKVVSQAERSSVRTEICLSLSKFFENMATETFYDSVNMRFQRVTKSWLAMIGSEGYNRFGILQLLNNMYDVSMSWVRREKYSMTLSAQSLARTCLLLLGDERTMQEAEAWTDSVLKFMSVEQTKERLSSLNLLSSLYGHLSQAVIASNEKKLWEILRFVIQAVIASSRKRPLVDEELAALGQIVIAPCNKVPAARIFLPIVQELLTNEAFMVEFRSFGLFLLKLNATELLSPEYNGDLFRNISLAVVTIIEDLKDRDLVRDALPVLPFLKIDEPRQKSKILQVIFGLTKAKYKDIAQLSVDAIRNFAKYDPSTSLLPILNLFLDLLRTCLNDDLPVSDAATASTETSSERLHYVLAQINLILSDHVSTYQDNLSQVLFPVPEMAWNNFRLEIESLAVLLMLRVSSARSLANEDEFWARRQALSLINNVASVAFQRYELSTAKVQPMPYLWDSFCKHAKSAPVDQVANLFSFAESDPWLKDMDHFREVYWFDVLERVMINEWDLHCAVFLKAWRHAFLNWSDLPERQSITLKLAPFQTDGDTAPQTDMDATYITWLNVLTFMFQSVKLSISHQSKGFSSMEVRKFIHDNSALLYACVGSNVHVSTNMLGPLPKGFLWVMQKQRDPLVFELLIASLCYAKEEMLQSASHSDDSVKPHQVNFRSLPSIRCTPFVIFLMASWISSSSSVPATVIASRSEIFQHYWRLFRFWLSKDHWNLVKEHLSTETRYHLAIAVERLMRFTDPAIVDRLCQDQLEFGQVISEEILKNEALLDMRSYTSFVLAFCSVLQRSLEIVQGDFHKDIDVIVANLFASLTRCGPLPEKSRNKSGTVSLPETVHLHILSWKFRGDHVEHILKDAAVNLLKFNPQLSELFLSISYSGWSVPENVPVPSRWDETSLQESLQVFHLEALASNFASHPKRWTVVLTRARLMYLSLLYQCSDVARIRVLGLSLTSSLLRGAEQSEQARAIVGTLPASESLENYMYFEKAYQFSAALSLVFPEELEGFLSVVSKDFKNLCSSDHSHVLNLLAPWGKLIARSIIAKREEAQGRYFEPVILNSLLALTQSSAGSIVLRKSIEYVWRGIFSELGDDEAYLFEIVGNYLLRRITSALTSGDDSAVGVCRDVTAFIMGSQKGAAIVNLLVESLHDYSKARPQSNPAETKGLSTLRIDTSQGHIDTSSSPQEHAAYLLLVDVAFKAPELLVPHLAKILHCSLVLFDGIPIGKTKSLGNDMLWYLMEFLALRYAADAQELKKLSAWQRRWIADPMQAPGATPSPLLQGMTNDDRKQIVYAIVSIFGKKLPTLKQSWIKISCEWARFSTDTTVAVRSCQVYCWLISRGNPQAVPVLLTLLQESIAENTYDKTGAFLEALVKWVGNDTDAAISDNHEDFANGRRPSISNDSFAPIRIVELSSLLIPMEYLSVNTVFYHRADFLGAGIELFQKTLAFDDCTALIPFLVEMFRSGKDLASTMVTPGLFTTAFDVENSKKSWKLRESFMRELFKLTASEPVAEDSIIAENLFASGSLAFLFLTCVMNLGNEDDADGVWIGEFSEYLRQTVAWLQECCEIDVAREIISPILLTVSDYSTKFSQFVHKLDFAKLSMAKAPHWDMHQFMLDLAVSGHAIIPRDKVFDNLISVICNVYAALPECQVGIVNLLLLLCVDVFDVQKSSSVRLTVRQYEQLYSVLRHFYTNHMFGVVPEAPLPSLPTNAPAAASSVVPSPSSQLSFSPYVAKLNSAPLMQSPFQRFSMMLSPSVSKQPATAVEDLRLQALSKPRLSNSPSPRRSMPIVDMSKAKLYVQLLQFLAKRAPLDLSDPNSTSRSTGGSFSLTAFQPMPIVAEVARPREQPEKMAALLADIRNFSDSL